MSMSTHLEAFKPPGDKWKRMKAVYDSCTAAGVEIPGEVLGFFNHEAPDDAGVRIEESDLRNKGAVSDWKEDMREGIEVDVTKLPRDVTLLRFVNSY